MDDTQQIAALGRALKQLLLASYGMYPADLAREVADAARHLGGRDAVLLLSDYDQRALLGFDLDDERAFPIDGPGPGRSYREETILAEALGSDRRLWIPIKDSAERLGVLGIVDDGTVALDHWEAIASLTGELIVSKASYGDHIALRKRGEPFTIAAEMRWSLLPPLTFTGPDLSIAGFLQPSHGIAGDAFDYAVTDRSASIGIFDAMGHGIEASRMANIAIATYRNARRADASAEAMLVMLDEMITSQFGNARFVTAQIATLELDTGAMEIANAGHLPPLLIRPGAPPEELPCAPSRPAGLETQPTTTSVSLEPGQSVLFRTDGIDEARAPDGELFSLERLVAMIGALGDDDLPPSEVLRRCVHAVVDHEEGRPGDDASLLLVTWKPPHEVRAVTRG